MHPGGVRSAMHLFNFDKSANLKHPTEYAAEVYQPGKERKETAAKILHREKIILYFKERVAELGINVVV